MLVGAAVTLLAGGVGVTAARADVPGDFYGVNVQQVFSGQPSSWEPDLTAMAGGGLSLARIDARWQNVEPNPPSSSGQHTYNWSMYDGIVQGLAQHGLRWLPIVDYSTTWSGVTPGDTLSAVAPAHIPDFAAYAAALARRYGRGGTFWQSHPSLTPVPVTSYEIWNEENSTVFWRPQAGNAEAYADLYMAARSAIRGVDPQARVIVGGLALNNPPDVTDEIDFVRRMFAHRPDLAGNVDGVGLHPYQQTVTDTYMRLAKFRQGLNQIAGASVPIEITEVGWATTSVSDAERASDLAMLAVDLPRSDCNVDMFLPYTWLTQEMNPGDPEDWFGIWNRDGSPRPSGQAYLNAVQLMRGMAAVPAPGGTVPICSTDYDALQAAPPPPPPPPVTPTTPRGPRLILHVRGRHHHRLLLVAAQCHAGCKLDIAIMARHPHRRDFRTRVASRLTGFSTKRRVLRIRVSRRVARRSKRVQLVVTAIGRSGGATIAVRRARVR